ncbi:putative bifunctional diguanylate cyclase/phosphodiesterase [Egicoccus halophilus]|uniref:Diguanylate cyclase (GGDEF) domain-containing protein n=1 Tax=Egicoccus halophilus TaxID=1670830 RepID=A0A8J3AAP6_9ACTN|nr:EAL domain-containing protein [Egicoccus halophilus]GGI03317.1 hypothetical protein GCM10011354_03430 [Egicoccus halophilus]
MQRAFDLIRHGPPSAADDWPLLQRMRWRFVLLNLVTVAVSPFSLPYLLDQPGGHPWRYLAAMVVFGAWNLALYRTAGRSAALRLAGPVLVGGIALAAGHHTWAFGPVFTVVFLDSLYGDRRSVVRSALAYLAAYELAVAVTAGRVELLSAQLASMSIGLLVVALMMAEMARILRTGDQARRRDEVLATVGRALRLAPDADRVLEVAAHGIAEVVTVSGAEPVQVGMWRRRGGDLVLVANWGEPSAVQRLCYADVAATLGPSYDPGAVLRLSPEQLRRTEAALGSPASREHGLSLPLGDDDESLAKVFVRSRRPVSDDEVGALRRFADEFVLADRAARHTALLSAVVDGSPSGIALVDDADRLAFASPAVAELAGRPIAHGDPIGTLLVHGPGGRRVERLADLDEHAGDLAVRRPDGTLREVEVSRRDLPGEGTVLNLRDVSDQRRLQEEISFRAFHDTLTGIPNRALFLDRLDRALAQAARHGTTVAVALLDLDDFKAINDGQGHLAGDRVLAHVAGQLQARVREADTVARLGGDEFALLLDGVDAEPDVEDLLNDLLAGLREPVQLDGHAVSVAASCGLVLSRGEHDAAAALGDADLAMYAAKEAGKGTVVVFDRELRVAAEEHLLLRGDLEVGIGRDELRLHYQPVVAVADGHPIGAEALVRWEHPHRGLLYPDAFVPIAERSGLVGELGRWVLRAACREVAGWIAEGTVDRRFQVHVNLSAHELAGPDLVGEVERALTDAGLDPAQLVIEITETALASNPEIAEQTLRALHRLGIGIAIDDFGTGYASFTYLRRFPVDIVKIDRSFVTDVTDGPEQAALAQAIVRLASSLCLSTVAEGVERPETRELLAGWGCEHGQGWLWSKAVPGADFVTWMRRHRAPEPPLVAVPVG